MIDRTSTSFTDSCSAELTELLEAAELTGAEQSGVAAADAVDSVVLARYGLVPQVARFGGTGEVPTRDQEIVVTTERGKEAAVVLQALTARATQGVTDQQLTGRVLRLMSSTDHLSVQQRRQAADQSFAAWMQRAAGWKLQLQIIDLEHTLDDRLILYVLNDRGPETTRLALLAAAAGHGVIHVQPVSAAGIVPEKSGGGCGDCGCSTH